MKDFIIQNLIANSNVSFIAVTIKLIMTLIIASTQYVSYYYTSNKLAYNSNFNLSLVAMAIITTAIMSVITSNIALSLGMVGALSIIRFRTAIKDPRDAMFIFWSIMIGICCGVAQYLIALSASFVLLIFFFIAKAIKEQKRYLLIIRCRFLVSEEVKAMTYRHYKNCRIAVTNTTSEMVEMIYELKQFENNTRDYLKELYTLEGIECANFVLQEDKTNA